MQESSGTSALFFHLFDNEANIHEVHLSDPNCESDNTSDYQQSIHDQVAKKDNTSLLMMANG